MGATYTWVNTVRTGLTTAPPQWRQVAPLTFVGVVAAVVDGVVDEPQVEAAPVGAAEQPAVRAQLRRRRRRRGRRRLHRTH